MAKTRILGVADVHLGFRQYGLRQREQDIEDVFRTEIVDYAISNGFHAIVVAGDMLDSVRPTSRTYEFLRLMHGTAVEHDIPILVSPGNHDASVPHWVSQIQNSQLSTNGLILLDNSSRMVNNHVLVHGVPCMSRQQWEGILPTIPACNLLMMHQSFKEFIGFPSDTAFSGEDLLKLQAPMEVLVGDIHVNNGFTVKTESGTLNVISPGSTELMSTSEDTTKYRIEYTFDDDKVQHLKTELKTRKVIVCDFRCEDDQVQTLIEDTVKQASDTYPILRVKYYTNNSDRVQRLRKALVGKEYLFKPEPISVPTKRTTPGKADEEELQPIDIVRRNLDVNSNLFPLMSRLFDKACDARAETDEYIERRLGNLETADVQASAIT